MPTSEQFKAQRYQQLLRIAKNHGGSVLTRGYSDLRSDWTVKCAEGHRFRITPKNMMRGLWCVKCRPLARQSEFLEQAKTIARKHQGKCLATSYENAREKLPWQCKEGHRWEASFDNVANKESWCPTCNAGQISVRKKRWWRQQLAHGASRSKARRSATKRGRR